MRLSICFLLAATGAGSAQSFAQSFTQQQIKLQIKADSSSYEIGDPAVITLTAEGRGNLSIEKPALQNFISGGELTGGRKPETRNSDGKTSITFRYIISRYDSGIVAIPSFPVRYRQGSDTTLMTAFTDSISVLFRTLVVDTAKDMKDIKAPVKIPLGWKTILMYVLIAMAVTAAVFYLYRYIRNRRRAEPQAAAAEAKLSPYESALMALGELERKQLWQNGKVKQYYTEVTDIIRNYFEEEYHINAPELTTDEFTDELKKNRFEEKLISLVSLFLTNADLVKFAKFEPSEILNSDMLKHAYEILEKSGRKNPEFYTVGSSGITSIGSSSSGSSSSGSSSDLRINNGAGR